MVALDGTVVSVANPTIGRDLHASLSDLQWVTNGYLLAIAVLLVFGGRLGDRFGRKRLFMIGMAGFALGSLGCALSPSIDVLILFRVVQGMFGAMMLPATLACLRAAFPADELEKAVGIWGGTSAIATASGPIIGGLLVQHVSWESIFLLNLPLGAVALVVAFFSITETKDVDSGSGLDPVGVVLLSGSLFALAWGLIKSQTHGWGSAYTLGFLAAAVVLTLVFIVWENRVKVPLIPLGLFKSPSFSAGRRARHPRSVRALRRAVLHDAVPAAGPRLLARPGGRAAAAADRDVLDLVAARRRADGAIRAARAAVHRDGVDGRRVPRPAQHRDRHLLQRAVAVVRGGRDRART